MTYFNNDPAAPEPTDYWSDAKEDWVPPTHEDHPDFAGYDPDSHYDPDHDDEAYLYL